LILRARAFAESVGIAEILAAFANTNFPVRRKLGESSFWD
jgi:hypothetical protein